MPAPRVRWQAPARPKPAAPRVRKAPPTAQVPQMRQLCRKAAGVTSDDLARLCTSTYGR
ncbi:hypothetical protein SCWH03_19430 [Streptomyces pacificus]|uniref:Uncharacterized protein n=1 Tax=Streptomyces pacificus TaxID=2705029 RepID=A0A6A0ATS2_9ACTN|nr:hypothetical protein SCWH03_19430 [Streptomyces pacificus]